eukprot:scaffold37503_cov75-Attheya_sp.AAC.2
MISNLTNITGNSSSTGGGAATQAATARPPAPSAGDMSQGTRSTGTALINQNINPKVKQLAGVGWKSQQVQWKISSDCPKNKGGASETDVI